MDQVILENAVQALRTAGFDTERGFFGAGIQRITGPVCAVNLQSAALFSGSCTVTVRVLSPAELGAEDCEDAALQAAQALRGDASACHVGRCSFDGRTGLFSVEITAVFLTDLPSVTLGTTAMKYVRSFTSWRTGENDGVNWSAEPWEFQIEEYIPLGCEEQEFPEENFTVSYTRDGKTEGYLESSWTYRKRQQDAGGLRQIWRGTAVSRMEVTAE